MIIDPPSSKPDQPVGLGLSLVTFSENGFYRSWKDQVRCDPHQTYQLIGEMMNIDNLTFGELKQIAALFGSSQPVKNTDPHPMVGQYCIARCYAAGVHAGEVVSVDGENVILKDSRRLWSWKAKDGVALSGVAQTGIQSGCKIDVANPVIYLTGVCELIPCSEASKVSINDFKK